MAECRLRRADGTVDSYPLSQGPATIGRGSMANLRIDDEFISRIHCEVFLRDKEAVIRDLNSRNGTFVNGHRTQEKVLGTGDRIQVGETFLSFQLNSEILPPVNPGEPPRHETDVVLRIVPRDAAPSNPAATVLIPKPKPAPSS